jgi:oligosaccharide repeat unit polymerase
MIFFIIGIFFFLLALSRYALRDKLSLNFLVIYQIWWLIMLAISVFNPFSLYAVSDYTYFLLVLNVFFFSIGFVISRVTAKIKVTEMQNNFEKVMLDSYNNTKDNKLFLVVLVLFSAMILNYLLKYQQVILLEGVEESRTMRYFVGKVFSTQIEIYFYNYVIESFSVLVLVFLAFSFVWMRFNIAFFVSLFFAYLFSSFGSGRGYIIELGFLIGFLFLVKNTLGLNKTSELTSQKNNKIRKKKIIAFFVLVPTLFSFYLFSIYLSNLRNGLFEINYENFIEGNNYFFEQIVIYCVGSFRALDYGVNVLCKTVPLGFGSFSFAGLDEIFGFLLKFLGINYNYSNLTYGEIVGPNFKIGYDQEYNALFTNTFSQYLDFGILGVVFLSFFWGFVFNRFIVAFMNNFSLYKLLIVAYLFVIAIMSVLTWKLQAPSSFIFLILLVHLEYGKSIKKFFKPLLKLKPTK